MARAGVLVSFAVVLAGCAGLSARRDAPGQEWYGQDPNDLASATGERNWSAFVAAVAWDVESDGEGETPLGSGSGPEGDGRALSLRSGATWDFPLPGAAGGSEAMRPEWLPEGWRPCWGVELEYRHARTSDGGSDDPRLELTTVELLLPIGLRKPGPWPGADEHRVDLLLGGVLHSLDLEDADLAAVQSDDSPTIGGFVFGARAHVSVVERVFVFAQGEFGGLSSSGGFGDEVDEDFEEWSLGAGVHLARGVTLQVGWRDIQLEREETDTDFFIIFPIAVRESRNEVDLSGPFVELVVTF